MAVETATVQSLIKEITSNLMKMPGKLATGHFCCELTIMLMLLIQL